jgi:hypothetical protein
LGEHLPCKQGVSGSNPLVSIEGEASGEAAAHAIFDIAT